MSARRALMRTISRATPGTRLYGLRRSLLRAQGFTVAATARVTSSVSFMVGSLSIGEDAFVGHRLHVYGGADSRLVIGDRCALGPDICILAGTHEVSDGHRRAGADRSTTVVIEDGCWIGGRAVLVGPCRIGAGSIVAAGATVRSDVPPHSLYFGPRASDLRPLPS